MNKKPTIKDLFKTYKLRNYSGKKFGYSSLLWRIVRNTEKKTYYYLFRDFAAGEYRVLHSGIDKVKPLTPCVLSIFCIVFNLFWIPFIIVTFIPYSYFEGGKNWITDSAWENNIRFFNCVNIILVIVLTVLLIIK